MKIDKYILKEFLEKINMSGTQIINECVLKFNDDGIYIIAVSKAQQAQVEGFLSKDVFDDYVKIGDIGVNDLDKLLRVIDRFHDTVTITSSGNLLTLSSTGKKVDVELIDSSYIESGKPIDLKYNEVFYFPLDKIKEAIDDASLSKDGVLTIRTEPKKLHISNTGKYKFTHEFIVPDIKGGSSLKMGSPFVDAVKNLNDTQLMFEMTTDYPLRITEKTESSKIVLIIAPRVSTDE